MPEQRPLHELADCAEILAKAGRCSFYELTRTEWPRFDQVFLSSTQQLKAAKFTQIVMQRHSSTIESYIANDQTLLGLDQSRQFVVYVAAYGVADAVFL